jgi:hypothetical protein
MMCWRKTVKDMNRWRWRLRSQLKYVRTGEGREVLYRENRLFLLRGEEKRNVDTCHEG